MKPKIFRFGREIRAFSLVEVVLAVGVVSFALLSVLAMLPIGLTSVQNAELLQATGNISDQLRGQLPLLSFNPTNSAYIGNLAGTTNYYTTDGISTNAAAGYYAASFQVLPVGTSSSVPVVNAGFTTNNAMNVTVTLTYPPGAKVPQTNSFSFFVARQTGNN